MEITNENLKLQKLNNYRDLSRLLKETYYNNYLMIPENMPKTSKEYYRYIEQFVFLKPILHRGPINSEDAIRLQAYLKKMDFIRMHNIMIRANIIKKTPINIKKRNIEVLDKLARILSNPIFSKCSGVLVNTLPKFFMEDIKCSNKLNLNNSYFDYKINDKVVLKQIISNMNHYSSQEKENFFQIIDQGILPNLSHLFENPKSREIFMSLHKLFCISEKIDPVRTGLDTSYQE